MRSVIVSSVVVVAVAWSGLHFFRSSRRRQRRTDADDPRRDMRCNSLGGICTEPERRAQQLRDTDHRTSALVAPRAPKSQVPKADDDAAPRASKGRGTSRIVRLPPAPYTDATHFRVVRVPMDGSCFYHACVEGLQQVFPKMPRGSDATVRARVARVLAQRAERPSASASVRDAARRCTRPHAWAHEEEVGAAAEALSVHVLVYEGANRCWVSFGDEALPAIYMLNHSMVHFDALVPVHETSRDKTGGSKPSHDPRTPYLRSVPNES